MSGDRPVNAVYVNGTEHSISPFFYDLTLAHFLHEHLGLTGTRIGCGIGECRACTVMVRHGADGVPVTKQACMTSMRHVGGWHVTTIEALAEGERLHPVQEAIVAVDAFQCGYCSGGFAVAGAVACEQLSRNAGADAEEVIEAVAGHNLCRCTGYWRYRRAIAEGVAEFLRTRRGTASGGVAEADGPPGNAKRVPSLRSHDESALKSAYRFSDASSLTFASPRLQLIHLLRGAAEVEHSLMIQFLYATFSIKLPTYSTLAGWPSHRYSGRPLHMFGVAIEEMVHLDVVNGLLVALGAAPNLEREQFPYKRDIYPFEFALEPLTRKTIARYTFVEAPREAVEMNDRLDCSDRKFVEELQREMLGPGRNAGSEKEMSNEDKKIETKQVGSLYHRIEAVFDQFCKDEPGAVDGPKWRRLIRKVRDEGEMQHFELFRSIFDGTHPAFAAHGGAAVWCPEKDEFPSKDLKGPECEHHKPLKHLSNLHYWLVCMLLDLSYRHGGRFHNSARRHMTGPMRSIGSALAGENVGIPFDVLPFGYAAGLGTAENVELVHAMLREIMIMEREFEGVLPHDYARRCALETRQELSALTR